MSNDISIDPITEKEFNRAVKIAFDKVVDEITASHEFNDPQTIAEVFFTNGFLQGCLAMTDNEDLKETLYMITKEIDYQKK